MHCTFLQLFSFYKYRYAIHSLLDPLYYLTILYKRVPGMLPQIASIIHLGSNYLEAYSILQRQQIFKDIFIDK